MPTPPCPRLGSERTIWSVRLDKLRGFGPWFAFAVPFLFLVTFGYWVVLTDQPARAAAHRLVALTLHHGLPAPSFGAAVELWFVLWALIVLAGLVVAIDLEWIEHPLTNTPMAYVALGGMVVATLALIVILADGFANFGVVPGALFRVAAFLVSAGFGVYLVVVNLVGKRAGLLGRVLPWLGVVSGALFLVAALLIVVGLPEAAGFGFLPGAALYGFLPGAALYAGWSLWLGFRLRGRAPKPALSSTA